MAKKLNSMPDYQARMPKHPHDVSQSTAFTASTGMLLPVYFDMLHSGDELHFNASMFTRLNPLNVPSLGDIDLHLDYFFVPLSVMYTPATSIFYQTDDLFSSAVIDVIKTQFPLFDIDTYLHTLKDTVNGNMVQPTGTSTSVNMLNSAFDCKGKAAIRLCDLLEYSYYNLFSVDKVTTNPSTTPWFLAAYHACYELYFRNDDREGKYYGYYNLDSYGVTQQALAWQYMLNLHYASSYKDYFNSVKVSPIGSSVSMLNGSASWDMLSKVNSYLFDYADYRLADTQGTMTGAPYRNDSLQTNVSSNRGNLTSANIRQLFMVDKLLRITGRANKDYESQFLAHFGIKVPHDDLHNITHIGHDMVSLRPSPVISSADTFDGTGGSALGEVGGQGYVNLTGRKHNFRAPFHGVFMVIFHAQPKFRYFPGISKLHDLSDPMKFWQAEYDKKGMEPLFAYEWYKDEAELKIGRSGWQFAYEVFKRKYDRVSLAFRNPTSPSSVNTYAPWVISRSPYALPKRTASWSFISDDFDIDQMQGIGDFTSLLSTPHDLDMIMQVPYQSTWIQDLTFDNAHLLFATDPLISDFHLTCKKVNFMSEYGEPELD